MIFLAFVVPLAIYFATLAGINRAQHPAIVSGRWDFAGILFAVSGFLLLGGPAILTGFYDDWRLGWILGRGKLLAGIGDHWFFWLGLWGVYFVVVLAWAGHYLYHRGRVTSIYNIDTTAFFEVFNQVLAAQGVETLYQEGNRFSLLVRKERDGVRAPIPIEIDPFPRMFHVSLHWPSNAGALRAEIETELERVLLETLTPPHPAGFWLMLTAVTLVVLSALIAVGTVALQIVHSIN